VLFLQSLPVTLEDIALTVADQYLQVVHSDKTIRSGVLLPHLPRKILFSAVEPADHEVGLQTQGKGPWSDATPHHLTKLARLSESTDWRKD
jgi:hypothetical protein